MCKTCKMRRCKARSGPQGALSRLQAGFVETRLKSASWLVFRPVHCAGISRVTAETATGVRAAEANLTPLSDVSPEAQDELQTAHWHPNCVVSKFVPLFDSGSDPQKGSP